MRSYAHCSNLLSVIIVVIVLGIYQPIAMAQAPFDRKPKFALETSERIRLLETVLSYIYNFEDKSKQHKPWLCVIGPEVGIAPKVLAGKLKRIGAQMVDASFLGQDRKKGPKHFVCVSIEKFMFLTKRRVRVSAGVVMDFDPPILTEATGTLYVNRLGRQWIVDEKKSKIQVGE